MKKFIQASSFLGFLVLFASLSVSAQKTYQAEVEVPFPFIVGERSYDAGKYNIRIESSLSSSRILTLTDKENNLLQIAFMHISGERPASGDVRMVFDKVGDKNFLSRVRTSSNTFSLARSKRHREEIKRSKETETLLARGN